MGFYTLVMELQLLAMKYRLCIVSCYMFINWFAETYLNSLSIWILCIYGLVFFQSIHGETQWQCCTLSCWLRPSLQSPPPSRPLLLELPGEPFLSTFAPVVPLGPSFLTMYLVFFFLFPCSFCSFSQLKMKRFSQFQCWKWENCQCLLKISGLLMKTCCAHTGNSLGASIASFTLPCRWTVFQRT